MAHPGGDAHLVEKAPGPEGVAGPRLGTGQGVQGGGLPLRQEPG